MSSSETCEEWAFAERYTLEDMADEPKRRAFLADFVRWEARFITGPGVNASGLTNDGANANGRERPWSAASKEALHLCVLARCISKPSPLCEHIMSAEAAAEALGKKVGMYEKFRADYPQFHGFLPWFKSATLEPTNDWKTRWPCLDNGQFAWGLYEVIHATKNAGHDDLSARFRAHFDEMCDYAVIGGYRGNGEIAMISHVVEEGFRPEGHDPMPWDQEPFSYFVDMFGNWEKAGYSAHEREKIWADRKRHQGIHRRPFMTQDRKPIAVLQGWHFSSHELWKYLQLPLRKIECTKNLLINCERARTTYAAERSIPGLWASCTTPDQKYCEAGIAEGISLMATSNTELLTPYGGFPTLLADEAVGAAWLRNVLRGPAMQGPLGSSESIWADGSATCHILTWDAKVTTVLAVLGGGDHLEAYLQADGLWDRFQHITTHMYENKFGGNLNGSDLPLRLPTSDMPHR
eukprot:TRINITY_DN24547_c0_g2_i1.p1 TRINITY_DN24547_c0_g2~~TRINITY_DN24547_c0_g2_i1.p1  ORF type:complete len:464 (-),score=96.80 TRINITY_DN24547_c0_g2_i1:65-1456(-)